MGRLSWRRGANKGDMNKRESRVFRIRSGPQPSSRQQKFRRERIGHAFGNLPACDHTSAKSLSIPQQTMAEQAAVEVSPTRSWH
jgi:hypothetical protein